MDCNRSGQCALCDKVGPTRMLCLGCLEVYRMTVEPCFVCGHCRLVWEACNWCNKGQCRPAVYGVCTSCKKAGQAVEGVDVGTTQISNWSMTGCKQWRCKQQLAKIDELVAAKLLRAAGEWIYVCLFLMNHEKSRKLSIATRKVQMGHLLCICLLGSCRLVTCIKVQQGTSP